MRHIYGGGYARYWVSGSNAPTDAVEEKGATTGGTSPDNMAGGESAKGGEGNSEAHGLDWKGVGLKAQGMEAAAKIWCN